MTILKKSLIAMLAAAVLFAGTSAYAATYVYFPDVPDDAAYAEEVNYLAEIGVFTGDENGNYNPNSTITRAEFAAIVTRLLGEENKAKTTRSSNFTDVPSSHWANGYVAVAVELGLINGYGNGRYGPEDTLTYEQAQAVLIRVIGYDEDATAAGGWPYGYNQIAKKLGITDGLNIYGTDNAKRGITAVLIYQAMAVLERVT